MKSNAQVYKVILFECCIFEITMHKALCKCPANIHIPNKFQLLRFGLCQIPILIQIHKVKHF